MFVPTRASTLKRDAENSFQCVTFQKRVKKQTAAENTKEVWKDVGKLRKKSEVPDMKKLRYEVIKFGTSGFSGALKEDANVALMVSLGAEPPKKKGRNYKELLEEKKAKANNETNIDVEKYKSLLPVNKNKGNEKKRKNDVKGLLNVYGEVKHQKKGRRGEGGGKRKRKK